MLIDTSAWIEFLRHTGSQHNHEVRRVIANGAHICDPIIMELLAGARDNDHLTRLKRLIARVRLIDTISIDYENAAAIYRVCRRQGLTIRTHIDCLIAAIAIRNGTPVLHNDEDFTTIAQVSDLQIHAVAN